MAQGRAKTVWPTGDSEVAGIMRGHDWSAGGLGPVEGWTPSLKMAVDLMLAAQAQIVLFCGPELVAIYNDAYAPTIGNKHPKALGRPAKEFWGELWDDLEPLLMGVLETGETFADRSRPFYIERGEPQGETVYFDISYSAVRRADATVEAVLCIVSETTRNMAAARQIRDSEERFRALVNASADVIYRMSPDWREMRQLDGRGLLMNADGPTLQWKQDYIFPEDLPRIQDAIDKAIRTRGTFSLEHRVRRADNSEGWILSRAAPIFDEHGQVAEWFGMASDITERKEAERRIGALTREVSHRVKNQFAVILSMIRETSSRTTDPREVEAAIRRRIMALAKSHDLLVSSDWNGAALDRLILAHVEPYGHKSQVSVSGPPLMLRPNAVQHIGIALHELAANSLKFGALSGTTGDISVNWRILPDSAGANIFELTWDEHTGARPVETSNAEGGFGSMVLQRVTPASLFGSATIERSAHRLTWILRAPAYEVIAPRPADR